MSGSLVSLIRSGSEAQLNGELALDFTSSSRPEVVGHLKQGLLLEDVLVPLLVSTDEEIVLLALESLASKTRSHHLVHDQKTSRMVRELSRGWPPLDLLSCISGESSSWTSGEGLDVDGQEDCLGLFNRLVGELDVPADSRFGLLTRIRFAKAFSSAKARLAYVKIMILAMQLQWERKLMPGQLRKLVRSGTEQIPGSIRLLALETLTAYGETRVFSPADRQRRVEGFLSGRKREASFVEAILRSACSTPVTIRGHHHPHRNLPGFIISSASADNVVSWLEEEVQNCQAAEQSIVESLLLSRGLVRATQHRPRLDRCLLILFRNAELFGARVFERAASLFTPGEAELESAFMEAMLSVAIPSGWQVCEEAPLAFFFSHLTPDSEQQTINLILRDVELGRESFLLRHALQKQVGFTSSLLDAAGGCGDPELLVHNVDWMMRFGGLRQLVAVEKKVVAVFEVLAWPLPDACFSILEQLAESPELLDILLDSVLHVHGARFLLKLAEKCPGSERVLSAAWRHASSDQRRQLVVFLLLSPLEPPAAAAAVAVFTREDMKLVPGMGSKVLEMLRSQVSFSNSSATRRLLLILNHVLELFHADADNLFTPQHEDDSRLMRLDALAWYQTSLSQARGPGACTLELLKLGETLTRDYELAQELLTTSGLPRLVDTLLEVAADDPCAKSYAALTLVHLLEDDRVLHHSMVYKMWCFDAMSRDRSLVRFFTGMSSLAFRNPAIFLRACSCTFDFVWDSGVVDLKLAVFEAYRHRPPSCVRRLFDHLLDHLLARLDDAALELLTVMLVELPVFVKSAIHAGAVERVLGSSCTSEPPFSRFMEVLERHQNFGAISRALLNVFSSPDLNNARLINVCKGLPRCWEFVSLSVLERILKSLDLLDLDHPEAETAAASVFATVITIFERCASPRYPPLAFPGPKLSTTSVKAFRSQLQLMAIGGSSQVAEAQGEEEEGEEEKEEFWRPSQWKATDEQLEAFVGKFLCLAPRTGPGTGLQARLAELLVGGSFVCHASLSRVLLNMLQTRPGVPEFVLRRAFHLLWRLVREGFILDEGTALAFIPLLVSATKVCTRLASKLLEAVVLQLRERQDKGRTYSISLSEEQLDSLCHLAILTSDRLSNILVNLLSLDPALSSRFVLCTTALSREIISSALEALERNDYSSCGAVARLVQVFEGLPDAGAREQLARALAPLWEFIGKASSGCKGKRLIQAFFITQTLTSDLTPSDHALELLHIIGKTQPRLVKLALPMIRRWPSLKGVGFSTKLEFLRGSFAACPPAGDRRPLRVRRKHILGDSFSELGWLWPEFLRIAGNISVEFVGEPGYDAGGLTREWYQLFSRAVGKELFTDAGNPCSSSPPDRFRLAGRLVAKAIVDDQRLDIHFSRSFYKHLLGQEVSYQDMEDDEYLRNLNWLLEHHVDEPLGLTFSVDVESETQMTSYDLVAGGSDIPVTDENKHQYVKLLGEYLLSTSFRSQMDAFLDGFYELVPRTVISCFTPAELELLVCGLQLINVKDLRGVAKCKHEQQILEWFWETAADFDNQQRSLLLAFVTGSSKVPFSGVKKFLVGNMEGGDEYLPIARTCMSEILLPFYTTKGNLERKLLMAIHQGGYQFA